MSAYMIFAKENRENLRLQRPELSIVELSKLIGE